MYDLDFIGSKEVKVGVGRFISSVESILKMQSMSFLRSGPRNKLTVDSLLTKKRHS